MTIGEGDDASRSPTEPTSLGFDELADVDAETEAELCSTGAERHPLVLGDEHPQRVHDALRFATLARATTPTATRRQ